MQTRLRALALSALLIASPAGADPAFIDLDAAGALQSLETTRPDQHDIVRRILRDAERLPQPQVAGYLHTAYDASDVSLSSLLLVSYPPKRRLAFRLGDVSYAATVTVSTRSFEAMPAR